MKKWIISGIAFAMTLSVHAQQVQGFVHEQSKSTDYVWPSDPQVLQKLDQWQDLKFGVLFHWGLYSVPGIVESWSICSEDVDWITRKENLPYDEYKKWYFGSMHTDKYISDNQVAVFRNIINAKTGLKV